jgi:two-component system invasion response regulator UvrY
MRVIIVDDHVVFREGLKAVLAIAGDFEVVGEASTGREALALIETSCPDLVTLDLLLPELDGCRVAREVRRRCPSVKLFALTACDAAQDLLDAVDAGVLGFALKSESTEAVVGAMRRVAMGQPYVTPSLAHISRRFRRSGLAKTVLGLLSARERQVFRLATAGLPAAKIANQLSISRKTVETHRYRIQKKFGLRRSSDLVRFAALHDLISQEHPPGEGQGADSEVGLGIHP